MKKNANIIIGLSLVIVVVVAGLIYVTRPETGIVRIDNPSKMPMKYSGTKGPVAYIDYRGEDRITVYYDDGGKGKLENLGIIPRTWWKDHFVGYGSFGQNYLAWYEITTAPAAERQNFRSYTYNFYDEISLAQESMPAKTRQRSYEKIRENYQELHPEVADFPENQSYPEPPADPQPAIRADALKRFQDLFAFYMSESRKEEQVKGQKANEKVQLRAYVTFKFAARAYHDLNSSEKASFFDRNVRCNIPLGPKIGAGPELTDVFGISLSTLPIELQKDFETSFFGSYIEVDYMSAWSLTDAEQARIEQDLVRELRAKGLVTEEL